MGVRVLWRTVPAVTETWSAGALPEESLRQLGGTLEATGRTPESFGPPAGKEVITTSGVIWEAVLGLDDRPKEVRPRHAKIVPELTGYAELVDVGSPPQIQPRASLCVWPGAQPPDSGAGRNCSRVKSKGRSAV